MTGGEFGTIQDAAGEGGDVALAGERDGLVIMNQLSVAFFIESADEELAELVLAPSFLGAAEGNAHEPTSERGNGAREGLKEDAFQGQHGRATRS